MIAAETFVDEARARGFAWYTGVPCSYLTPFINYVLQADRLQYLSAANEGDAVAISAGVTLGGGRAVTMLQNSGLGNAVSPLTSLTWTFRLPQLLIVTWRGEPGNPDEPQHELMGRITPQMLETMEIPWADFPSEDAAVGPALDAAVAHMDSTGRPYALVMHKGTVAPYALRDGVRPPGVPGAAPAPEAACAPAGALPTRREALQRVIDRTPEDSTVVLASTGYCGRELYALADRPHQLYMVGSMGCVALLALGLALARPDVHVVALDGDGAALMRMGAFATLGTYGPPNLTHLLLDNGAHESTGGQATVSPNVSFAGVAAACGYPVALEGDDPGLVDALLEAPAAEGPRFARLRIGTGTPKDLPRPTVTPPEVARRLMSHLAERVAEPSAAEPGR
ncbi:phosphonopyruvate decarboxylase [Pseudonocardia halophobica]|uniref:Thiamine pyrophosphate enzyme n=1 Tax=Pseudonocardia halophobica TaxID=29401 RepID=A0A9W6L382_9PSEU|nr:phosphonopyruvate decarboxylase [Pseudonocardia halophobica]GLL12075.1 thiamine pyrophosphate enzyme [Pseudonocardia halophobica]